LKIVTANDLEHRLELKQKTFDFSVAYVSLEIPVITQRDSRPLSSNEKKHSKDE